MALQPEPRGSEPRVQVTLGLVISEALELHLKPVMTMECLNSLHSSYSSDLGGKRDPGFSFALSNWLFSLFALKRIRGEKPPCSSEEGVLKSTGKEEAGSTAVFNAFCLILQQKPGKCERNRV